MSFIKFVYHTNSYKNIDLEINNTVHRLFPDDEIDTEKSAGVIKIRTASVNKLSAVGFLVLFIERIILNIFNVFIMKTPDSFELSDPFDVWSEFEAESEKSVIKYLPSKISKDGVLLQEPQFLINGRVLNSVVSFNTNALNFHFIKFCFDVISLWIYSAVIISLIFVFSSKFLQLLPICVLLMCVITLPVINFIFKKNKLKKKVEKSISEVLKK